jgi:hypothetical protein
VTSLELSLVLRRCPAGNGVSVEAEEPPLLETVIRKRLVKTLQAGKDLVFAAVEISGGAVIACNSESCI